MEFFFFFTSTFGYSGDEETANETASYRLIASSQSSDLVGK
jgi:hypothetical protein